MAKQAGRPSRGQPSRRRHLVAGLVSLAAAVVFTALGYDAQEADRRLQGAPLADAVVEEVHDGFRRNDYLVVAFTTATGQQVRAELREGYWTPSPEVGDVVRVRYDPSAPTTYLRDVRRGDDAGLAIIGYGAAILFAVLAVASFAGRLPQWILEYNKRPRRDG